MDAPVHVVIDDALRRTDTLALHSQKSREQGGGDAGGDFQRTGGLGSVANHSGQIGNHVLD